VPVVAADAADAVGSPSSHREGLRRRGDEPHDFALPLPPRSHAAMVSPPADFALDTADISLEAILDDLTADRELCDRLAPGGA
jgi:hypothetical protein